MVSSIAGLELEKAFQVHVKVIIFPKVGIGLILATSFLSTDLMTTNNLVFNNNTKCFYAFFSSIFKFLFR